MKYKNRIGGPRGLIALCGVIACLYTVYLNSAQDSLGVVYSVSHKYSFLRQEIKAQPDEPVEIKLYRATYEAGDNNLEQMKLYNNNYKPYKTKELYTQGFRVSNADLCPDNGKHVHLLVLIVTTYNRKNYRDILRKRNELQGKSEKIKIAFLLGIPKVEEELESIMKEQEQHGDLIVNNIRDVYPNLSLKTLSGLDWTLQYCSEATFVAKLDDDVYINMHKVAGFLFPTTQNDEIRILGVTVSNTGPHYSPNVAFYVTKEQWNNGSYPTYLAGPCYILSNSAVRSLWNGATDETYFQIEDVWITGVLALQQNISREHIFSGKTNVANCTQLVETLVFWPVPLDQQLIIQQQIANCPMSYMYINSFS